MSDTLRQALADLLYERDADSFQDIAEAVVDVVLADPTISRALNIANAVDNAVRGDRVGAVDFPDGCSAYYADHALAYLQTLDRAAGETT